MTQRISYQMGEAGDDAAEKAAAHADTPTIAHLDTLGRTFLTVAQNRYERDGPVIEEENATRVELDIEGNQRQSSMQRTASSCATTTTCSATASTRPAWRRASAGC